MFDNFSMLFDFDKDFSPTLQLSDQSLGNELYINNQENIIRNESTNHISLEENNYSEILKYYYSLKKNKTNIEKEKLKEEKEKIIEEPTQKRQEAGIKHCVVMLLKFIRNIINAFIKNSSIKQDLKKNIYRPNSKLFTAKITESASSSSFDYSVLEIFSKGKDNDKNKKQKQNFDNINNILQEIEKYESKNKEDIEMLKIILKMKYLDLIKLFLQSEDFENFKKDKKTQFFDKEFSNQKQPSICEKKGFFFHFNLQRKKRKKCKFKTERNSEQNSNETKEILFNNALNSDSLTEIYKILSEIANN